MRGIVADCAFHGDNNSLSISSGIDPFRLRQYLLYWDKIDYPSNNAMYVELTTDEEYLKQIGILKRTHVNISTGTNGIMMNPEIFVKCQLYALKENNDNKKEIWSLGQNSSQLFLPEDETIVEDAIQLELYDCIPVPSEDTPFDDILKFKEKRKDELAEFRRAMDTLYDKIIESESQELQKKRCIEELQNKIIDINRVMEESRIKRALSSVNIRLNISNLLQTGFETFAGYRLGQKIGFPQIGAVAGLVSSAINISYNRSLKVKGLPDNLKDYAYLFYAKKEVI